MYAIRSYYEENRWVYPTPAGREPHGDALARLERLFHCKLKDLDLTFSIVVLFLFSS